MLRTSHLRKKIDPYWVSLIFSLLSLCTSAFTVYVLYLKEPKPDIKIPETVAFLYDRCKMIHYVSVIASVSYFNPERAPDVVMQEKLIVRFGKKSMELYPAYIVNSRTRKSATDRGCEYGNLEIEKIGQPQIGIVKFDSIIAREVWYVASCRNNCNGENFLEYKDFSEGKNVSINLEFRTKFQHSDEKSKSCTVDWLDSVKQSFKSNYSVTTYCK